MRATSRRGLAPALSLTLAVALVAAGCGRAERRATDAPAPTVSGTAAPVAPPGSTPPHPAGTASPVDRAPGTTSAPAPAAARAAVTPTGKATDAVLVTPDGRNRTYRLYVPPSLPPGAKVPLLLALHGGTGWGAQFERNSGFDGLAEANGFIVAYPDGIGTGPQENALRTWNGGECCGAAVKQQVDDVGFLSRLIDQLEVTQPVDPAQVYAIGHSNGGIMAYRLACELSDKVAAIGVQSTSLELATCQPSHPVAVLHVHGNADDHIPIDGGAGPKSIAGVDFRPPRTGVAHLAAVDGCPSTPTTAVRPTNHDLTDTVWAPCSAGTEVRFVEVAGAGHAWMGHESGGSGLVGPPYLGLDSSYELWSFVAGHPRRAG